MEVDNAKVDSPRLWKSRKTAAFLKNQPAEQAHCNKNALELMSI